EDKSTQYHAYLHQVLVDGLYQVIHISDFKYTIQAFHFLYNFSDLLCGLKFFFKRKGVAVPQWIIIQELREILSRIHQKGGCRLIAGYVVDHFSFFFFQYIRFGLEQFAYPFVIFLSDVGMKKNLDLDILPDN